MQRRKFLEALMAIAATQALPQKAVAAHAGDLESDVVFEGLQLTPLDKFIDAIRNVRLKHGMTLSELQNGFCETGALPSRLHALYKKVSIELLVKEPDQFLVSQFEKFKSIHEILQSNPPSHEVIYARAKQMVSNYEFYSDEIVSAEQMTSDLEYFITMKPTEVAELATEWKQRALNECTTELHKLAMRDASVYQQLEELGVQIKPLPAFGTRYRDNESPIPTNYYAEPHATQWCKRSISTSAADERSR